MKDNSNLFTEVPQQPWMNGKVYHSYECSKCGKAAKNTYCEPSYSQMLEHRMCFGCNHWREFEEKLSTTHAKKTIIDGSVYTPGNRTTGEFRGMAGRRFDIEYIAPSVHAGKRITTFDLWTGGKMPDWLCEKYPDTAVFLNDAERVEFGEESACWNPSSNASKPYPLPCEAGIK